MSQVLNTFDPLTYSSNNIPINTTHACCKLKMYNNSTCNIKLTFPGSGDTDMLHAKEANVFTVKVPTKYVEWEITSQIKSDPNEIPISEVSMVVYNPNEQVPGTYPITITHQTNIGNVGGVKSTVSGTNSLTNDGNPSGTTILESTVAGQAGSSITLTNDGLYALSVLVAGTLIQAIKTNNSGSLLQLGAASKLVEVLGALQVDGVSTLDNGNITTDGAGNIIIKGAKIGKSAAGDVLDASGVDTYVKSGGSFYFQSPNGTSVVQIDNQGAVYIHTAGGTAKIGSTAAGLLNFDVNGVRAAQINAGGIDVTTSTPNSITTKNLTLNNNGQINLIAGSLARLTIVSGTGTGTVNHGLGGMPRVCIPITSSGSSTQTIGATWNSTQVTVTTGNGYAWVCLCLA